MEFSSGIVKKEPVRCVIYGVEGIGKSTLASMFPAPVFIDTEHGTTRLNVKRAVPADFSDMVDGIQKLADGENTKTIIIDSLDRAEVLLEQYAVDYINATQAREPVDAIEDLPHGRGYVALDKATLNFISVLNEAWQKGKNIVLVAHAKVDKYIPVGEPEGYDRYTLKLRKRTQPFYKEWADMVLFANYRTIVKKDPKNKSAKAIAVGNERVLFTERTENFDAKNRYGLAPELPLDYESIKNVIEQDEE